MSMTIPLPSELQGTTHQNLQMVEGIHGPPWDPGRLEDAVLSITALRSALFSLRKANPVLFYGSQQKEPYFTRNSQTLCVVSST